MYEDIAKHLKRISFSASVSLHANSTNASRSNTIDEALKYVSPHCLHHHRSATCFLHSSFCSVMLFCPRYTSYILPSNELSVTYEVSDIKVKNKVLFSKI